LKKHKKILFIFGTRPEAIKLAPVIQEFQKQPQKFQVQICVTAQHREMLDQILSFFEIIPDYDLDIMEQNQSLFTVTSKILAKLEAVLDQAQPDLIFVQGDTTTSFLGALAGFYNKIKVAHIEAGLRTNDKYSPYPEEMNRALISKLADFHFAPTPQAKKNLAKEGITQNVWVVGNTGIDALLLGLSKVKANEVAYQKQFKFLDFTKKILLVTGHRRESFGQPFQHICEALKELAQKFPELQIVYPVHLNPNIRKPVHQVLGDTANIHLIEPLDYAHFIYLMYKSHLILTDSGGIQEEAPSLHKPVLVIRDVTERPEGLKAGVAKLVGTAKKNIVQAVSSLLLNQVEYKKMIKGVNPYGDGMAGERIIKLIEK
jgi:UDP-N-acetylglucosamine 2-epimerase (non-hydrolysing)